MLNLYGSVTLNNSTISGNSASRGGGIANYASNQGFYYSTTAVTTLNNSTVSGNSATINGGGIANFANASYYIAENHVATTNINNSTITGNSAPNGGGIYNLEVGGPGTETATVALGRSLVSGNSASSAGNELFSSAVNGNASAANNNLFGDSSQTNAQAFSGFTPGATDISATSDGTNPTALTSILDTTLADNGGPTLTHALVSGSPAVDASPSGLSTDQRGVSRPQDGDGDSTAAYDIGSFELGTIICGLTANSPLNFANLSLTVTNLGTDLDCVRATNIPHDHPNATPGIRTGQFWQLAGLQSNQITPAVEDFVFNLTLPHTVTPDTNANVCKYPGGMGGAGWDCGRTNSDGTTVWRDGISGGFSDWAVGDNVGPTAIDLQHLAANADDSRTGIIGLILAGLTAVTLGLWRRFRL